MSITVITTDLFCSTAPPACASGYTPACLTSTYTPRGGSETNVFRPVISTLCCPDGPHEFMPGSLYYTCAYDKSDDFPLCHHVLKQNETWTLSQAATSPTVVLDLPSTQVLSDITRAFTMTSGDDHWLPAVAASTARRNPGCLGLTITAPGSPTFPIMTGRPQSTSASDGDDDGPETTGGATGVATGADATGGATGTDATPTPEPTTDVASMQGGAASLKLVLGGLLAVAMGLGGL